MPPAISYHPEAVSEVPRLWRGDVLVVGGGSAGCAAAVAAARQGASTLLVESGGFLGGTGARVLDTFYGFYAPGSNERVVGGIGWEVCQRLTAAGMAFERPNTYGAGTGVTYEPEALKIVWDELVTGSGADLLLYGLLTGVVADAGTLAGAVVETRAGPQVVEASVVIDASGDAEVAWRAGVALERSAQDRTAQPATATFRVGGVDLQAASTKQLHCLMREAKAAGTHDLPRVEGSIHVTCVPGVRHANMTRVVGCDTTDPWQLTAAELEGRRQVGEYVRLLTEQAAGYDDAWLLQTSTRLGVRESRRLVGAYVLDRDDVLVGRRFDDAIARCGAPIEDHAAGEQTHWEYVGGGGEPTGRTYDIPYRSLLPVEADGLLLAGRCLSATHDAHASVRSMGQCMAMGQAAGTAAALSVDSGVAPRDVDPVGLRAALVREGALL